MTLEQYKAKLDEELKAMDWHERDIKNSRAYKVLSAAALDRENVPMEECDPKNFTDDWFCHFQRLVTQMAGRMMYFLQLKRKSSIKVKN